ncbi:hypothetical protein CBZ_13110 [Cellulomonas biazotea]|uniref:Uncharacterized protein n=1 Tax=Cellulomonas biazotea TaxID=1709 RepID=A0A402DQ59_9CELL|nr:hypothetical protein CBZ_13110 [Cellulomonas biazotea]
MPAVIARLWNVVLAMLLLLEKPTSRGPAAGGRTAVVHVPVSLGRGGNTPSGRFPTQRSSAMLAFTSDEWDTCLVAIRSRPKELSAPAGPSPSPAPALPSVTAARSTPVISTSTPS